MDQVRYVLKLSEDLLRSGRYKTESINPEPDSLIQRAGQGIEEIEKKISGKVKTREDLGRNSQKTESSHLFRISFFLTIPQYVQDSAL